jgi:HEAT repeat protein
LDGDNTKNPDPRTFLTKPEVEVQIDLYKEIPDPNTRSRIIFDIVRSNNPVAVPGLLQLLKSEKNPLLAADLLKGLFNLRKVKPCGPAPVLKRFLNDASPTKRAYAAALMIANSYELDSVLAALLKERSKFVLNLSFREMMIKPDAPPKNRLMEALKSKNPILASGAASILAIRSEDPDKLPELAETAKDESLTTRSGLASGLAERKSGGLALLTILAKDPNSSVRSFVASASPNPERLPLFLALSKDHDWDARRLAVVSLGFIKDERSIKAVLAAMSDDASPVRKAAENSLFALKPSDDVLNKMIEVELKNKKSRPSAITALGRLKFAPAAQPIAEILADSSDNDIILRSVKALGRLKHRAAWREVQKQAESTDPAIRSAVAESLGIFAEKKSFDTLLKLSDDKNAKVAAEAVKAMGVTQAPFFNNRLVRALKQVQSSADIRSNACWSSARTANSSHTALSQLERLALEQVIPAMGMMEYDSDFVRISAVLALIELGKTSSEAKAKAENALEKLQEESAGQFDTAISGDTLKEFARQAKLYMNGTLDIPKTPYPTTKPSLTATRMK